MYTRRNLFKTISVFIFMLLYCMNISAQEYVPAPTIVYFDKGENANKTVDAGESIESEAPLQLFCKANMNAKPGSTYTYEWRVFKTKLGYNSPLLVRYDADTEFTLTESDKYTVLLRVTENDGTTPFDHEDKVFSVSVLESELSCPDGFSPNGDGHNDVYNIKHKSIVKLQAVIFNRWGQKLKTLDLGNVDEGWDGTYNGRVIKDGVYFINLVAEGADGQEYKIKKAINVLKGYRADDETDGKE